MIYIDKFSVKVLDDLASYSISIMKGELASKDHNYTLKLSNSIGKVKKKTSTGRAVQITMEDYGLQIDDGYTKEAAQDRLARIGIASYVDQLKDWWMDKKGADEDAAEALARYTLKQHLKKGYKSKRSSGKGFIEYASAFAQKAATDILENRDLFTVALYDEIKSLAGKNIKITIKDVAGGNSNIGFSRNFSDIF